MAAHKRTKAQRDNHLALMFKMWVRGATQTQIAEKFGLTQQQVSFDLKEARLLSLPVNADELKKARADRMIELGLVKQEFWEEWDKRKLDKEVQISGENYKRQRSM